MAYGEPRLTNDVDIVAALEERHIPGLLAAFPSDEFYIDGDMIREAIRVVYLRKSALICVQLGLSLSRHLHARGLSS